MKTKLAFTVLVLTVLAASTFAVSKNGEKQSFDFNWKFISGDFPEASQPGYNDSDWRVLDVPHDFSIEHPFDSTYPTNNGGGFAYSGVGWYRKHFTLDKTIGDNKVFILFEGVYRNSEVWINGHYLGIRPYGYSSFFYDLTPYLNRAGEENIIAVKADTKDQMNSRWYTGAGIYRHVWLMTTGKVHFDEWGVFAKTQNASATNAQLAVDVELVNELGTPKKCQVITSLIDAGGKKVSTITSDFNIKAGDTLKTSQALSVQNPSLWSIKKPYLYTLQVELKSEDKLLDSYTVPFGIRTYIFDPNKGFLLNGEHIKLKGTNNHHDGGPLGSACLDYTFERQLQILKKMGCNALRMSHNPPAPELLNVADKLGFVVIDEVFDEWEKGKTKFGYSPHFKEWYAKDVRNWIKRDRNHPSVVAWSIGNEEPEQWDTVKGPEIAKKILAAARKHDTTRPFTIGADGVPGLNKNGVGEMLDMVGYNYQESMYKRDHETYPKRVIFGTETLMYPYHTGDCWQMRSYKEWLATLQEDYIAGEFIWTGFDYLGEGGIGEVVNLCGKQLVWPWWPSKSAACGLVDLCGFERPSYYFRKAIWGNQPVVYIATEVDSSAKNWGSCSFWSWPKVESHWNHHKEGDTLAVHVYTNVPDVELKLNGKSMGVKHWDLQKQAFPIWNIPFEKGTLEAIGTLANGEKTYFKVQTAGKPAKIKLVVDKRILKANKQDLSYIKAFLLDANNIPVPFAENAIEFEVTGSGTLNAVGNGNQYNHACYKAKQTKAFCGKCLAIVQSGAEKGKISLTAHSKGLPDATIEIDVK